MLALGAQAVGEGNRQALEETVETLVAVWDRPVAGSGVPAILDARLQHAVGTTWAMGWQPVDLARVMRRKLSTRHARLTVHLIACDARAWRHAKEADPRWVSQLAELHADAWWDLGRPLLPQWAASERLSIADALRHGIELLCFLWAAPPIPLLSPPPTDWGGTSRGWNRGRRPHASAIDAKVLGRVRALLAKAESTAFSEEAEALTAKAQQLMARHAIDQAMIDAGGEREVVGRRLGVDDPYAKAKACLLSEVAEASRCRSVWSPDLGFATVFGFPVDLEVVEVLYTSLLLQATTAMVAAGSATGAGRRSRSRSFRQSFLVAYGIRIGQRLRQSASAAVTEAQATHGDAMLPVLADRMREVDDACDRAFSRLSQFSLGANDGWGWAAGALAADQASLALGPELASAAGG